MDGEFIVSTDKKEKIKLDSRIVLAEWLSSVARGGAEAKLRVKTVFVAEGSSIEIKGRSSEGKAPDTLKGKVFNDEFIGEILIPEKVKVGADIWFEAKLPKHGLKMESGAIPARPAILVSKICWDRDTVKRGDEVKLSCQFESGVQDGEEANFVIYEHNPNSYDFKITSFQTTIENNKAEATWLFDYHDDIAQIATHEELKPSGKSYAHPQYYFIVVVDGVKIGEKRESGLMKFKDSLKLTFIDDCGCLLKAQSCDLKLPDGAIKKVTSNDNGILSQDELSPGEIGIKCSEIAKESISNPDSLGNFIAVVVGNDDEKDETVNTGSENVVMLIPYEQGKIEFVLYAQDFSTIYADREVVVEGNGILQKGKTDKNGVFSFKPVDYGDYTVQIGDGEFNIPAVQTDAEPYPVLIHNEILPDRRDLWKQPEDNEIEQESEEGPQDV